MQGKQLRKLEAELWRAADQLRANSKLTASGGCSEKCVKVKFKNLNNFDKWKRKEEQDDQDWQI